MKIACLFALLMVVSAQNQPPMGTSQVGDKCERNEDCAMFRGGACCVDELSMCSSDDGSQDPNGISSPESSAVQERGGQGEGDGNPPPMETGNETESGSDYTIWLIIIGAVVALLTGGGIWYFVDQNQSSA
eukprot:CAMPEP_0168608432 /NCGR_PEP_ID=MMETSP0449_2-20121227/623_1 /TAXON_ID=1082188 /ORGANISM="Strombidium rassoulzadegani, Strain ras09" /LENGTH=130 /DNA_ID=CAMNT_0008648415 /DNA_START=40 /DNA_END=432 /DNA_ORIENTATION=+